MTTSFENFALHPSVLQGLASRGGTRPTPLQDRTIPLILDGQDVLAQADSSSGKVLAYGLPLLSLLDPDEKPQALILVATKDRARRVQEALAPHARAVGLRIGIFAESGSMSGGQGDALRRGVDLLLGTPERLRELDHRDMVDLSRVRLVVWDDVEALLANAGRRTLETLMARLVGKEQMLAFSDALSPEVEAVATGFMESPELIRMASTGRARPAPREQSQNGHERPRAEQGERGSSRRSRGGRSRGRGGNSAPEQEVTRPETGPLTPLPRYETTWRKFKLALKPGHRQSRDSLHGWLSQHTGVPRSAMRAVTIFSDHATVEVEGRSTERFLQGLRGAAIGS
ncbi:MAG TPA: DEAD/DEAH box helicase [Oscillatoriaceae cyanobacterium]